MARSSSTFAKRQREQERRERGEAKLVRRAERKDIDRPNTAGDGEDPDLAGIVPGPQPIREEDF